MSDNMPYFTRHFQLEGLPPNTLPSDDLKFLGDCKHGDRVTLVGYINFGATRINEKTGQEELDYKFVKVERELSGVLFRYAESWFIQSDIAYSVWDSHIVRVGSAK